jgi:hypothetical protein
MATRRHDGTDLGSSPNLIVGCLIISVLLLLTGAGVFAGFLLAVLTTSAIFLNERLRSQFGLPIAGVVAVVTTGLFIILWMTY